MEVERDDNHEDKDDDMGELKKAKKIRKHGRVKEGPTILQGILNCLLDFFHPLLVFTISLSPSCLKVGGWMGGCWPP